MAPPTLSTGSRSVAFPSVSSVRNVPSWVSSTTRSWTTWYVVLLNHPAHGHVCAVYRDRGPGVLSHPGLWPTNETAIGPSETTSFPIQSTHRCVPHPSHIASFIPMILDVEWGSDRAMPVIELKCDAYLRLAADPDAVERGRMAHSLRTTGSGALNFCLVAQGAVDVCW
jgi:hypothetical protein